MRLSTLPGLKKDFVTLPTAKALILTHIFLRWLRKQIFLDKLLKWFTWR
jgi:hypothetical protein